MLYKKINDQIIDLDTDFIAHERKEILQILTYFIKSKININANINLNFICTHNSRRSHLSQVWAQAISAHYKIKNVYCYSGGTEATALFPSAVEALQSSGFKIKKLSKGLNPVYAIKYAENTHPIIGFSKTFDAEFNPTSKFAAIMTCSSADKGCPFIVGAEKRIPLTFEDPKVFDNTPQQLQKYKERSLQIATELKYIFQNIS